MTMESMFPIAEVFAAAELTDLLPHHDGLFEAEEGFPLKTPLITTDFFQQSIPSSCTVNLHTVSSQRRR